MVEEGEPTDIVYILVGAIAAMFGFIQIDGETGILIGVIGLGVFLYGLILNHLRHQGKK